jgi:peptide-methionine (S)-S-oxide reductase
MANEIIVLGGGCFWCTEAVVRLFDGIVSTTSGYAGGNVANPTSDLVYSGTTGHIEVVKIEYDPKKMPLDKLLDVFFTMHDPTSMDRQGADAGVEYRSVIFYTTDKQKEGAEKFIRTAQKDYPKKIVTEIRRLDKFYPAEEHHQNFYERNPRVPYCPIVIAPKIAKVKKKYGLA